ncbi:MAG: 30S ribosomal protein S17 [Nanoarchaeota archaeon]
MSKDKKHLVEKEGKIKDLVGARGRIFEGFVKKKFPKRITVEFERTLFIKKFERFLKKRTRLHARLPDNADVGVGDYVQIRECRPLSRTIHFIFTKKIRSFSEVKK